MTPVKRKDFQIFDYLHGEDIKAYLTVQMEENR